MRLVPLLARVVVASVLVAVLVAALPAGAQDAPWRTDDLDARIPLRDGKSLAADVLLPKAPGRYPAIVVQTPYDRTRSRAGLAAAQGGFSGGESAGGGTTPAVADREHYAYVVADWRGFFGSRGAGPAAPGSLGRDGFDVVEWAAAQPWCDGKVGTWGPSALGVVQFQTAAERPPHLVCAVPLVASYGYRYEDWFESGVLREHHVACLDRLGFGTGRIVRDARDPAGPVYRLARLAERPERIDVPVLMITGWFDHGTARQLETFAALRAQGGPRARAESRLLVGPWHHTAVDLADQGSLQFPIAAGEAGATTMAWFDRWLRGKGIGGFAADEVARVWRVGEDTWTRASEWPVATGAERTYTLHADGRIDDLPALADEAVRAIYDDPDSPVPTIGGANLPLFGLLPGPRDQKPLLARKDVLVYTTDPLAEPLRIDGAPRVTFHVATDAPDTDVAVRLCHVLADGRTVLLADSIARASWDAGRRVPLEPGEPREVTVRLPPLAVTFPRGTALRVLVSGTNSPRFERNSHTGSAAYDPKLAVAARVDFLHAPPHAARLSVQLARALLR